ncbi:hypothetical protein J2W37_000203 [Variovorax paradoxus]|nr:hypothetical protein [Variovorax paradoxus]
MGAIVVAQETAGELADGLKKAVHEFSFQDSNSESISLIQQTGLENFLLQIVVLSFPNGG